MPARLLEVRWRETAFPVGLAIRSTADGGLPAARPLGVWGGWKNIRGFTLLEILVATMIFATVLVALHSVFFAALRLQARTTEVVNRSRPVTHALSIMKKDLRGLLVTGGTLGGPVSSVPPDRGMGSAFTPQGYLEIHTTTGLLREHHPWGNLQRVAYYLAEPREGNRVEGFDLVRATTRNLLATFEEEPEEEPLLSGVSGLEFEFFDGFSWIDAWEETAVDSRMLQAIRVRVEFMEPDPGQPSRRPVELVVPVVGGTPRASGQGGDEEGGARP